MYSRRGFVLSGAALTLVSLAGCAGRLDGDAQGRIVTGEALTRVNAFRTSNGQSPLRADGAASAAALDHARRMAVNRQMAHNIGLGADFGDRMRRQGVALPAAENIATGQATVERALHAWEISTSHRANTLDPRFTGVGIAFAVDPARADRPYWAMILSGS
jgi:uncharacterized protein YkwD